MKYLIVVDMQNDFIDGSLGTKEAQNIVYGVAEKISKFDGEVVATQDTHWRDYLDTQEGRLLPVKHCIDGTDGWELKPVIFEALQKRYLSCGKSIPLFNKPTFGSKELGEQLENRNASDSIDEIVLVGLCTDICVISNALLIKAFLPEVKITVDASCCAGVSPESHENALRAMKVCQINIENWEG